MVIIMVIGSMIMIMMMLMKEVNDNDDDDDDEMTKAVINLMMTGINTMIIMMKMMIGTV